MRAINLKTNHLTAPVGIDAGPLFLSWQCADGVRQAAYEIEVTANNKTVWQSGKVQSSAMHADTPAVADSRVRGAWKIRLWDENDVPGAWSEARFETGLAQCDWVGEWVDPETEPIDIPGDDAINAFARPNWERKQAEKEAAGKGAAVQAPSSGIVPAQKLHGVQGRGTAVYHSQGIVRGMAGRKAHW